MRKFLIVIIASVIAGVSLLSAAETQESVIKSASLTISVKSDYTYSKFGVSSTEPDIDNLPTDTSKTTVALEKKTGTTSTGTKYIYASSTVYLYYYYVGKDDATLTVTAESALEIVDQGKVVSSIDYSIRFADANGDLVYPDNWDGGIFLDLSSKECKRISTDSSLGYGNYAEVKLKERKKTMMTRGIWPITIYTGSLYGDSYADGENYSGTITLALKTN